MPEGSLKAALGATVKSVCPAEKFPIVREVPLVAVTTPVALSMVSSPKI